MSFFSVTLSVCSVPLWLVFLDKRSHRGTECTKVAQRKPNADTKASV